MLWLGLGGSRGRSPQAEEASAGGGPCRRPPRAPLPGARDPVLGLAGRDLAAPSPRPGSNGASNGLDPARASLVQRARRRPAPTRL